MPSHATLPAQVIYSLFPTTSTAKMRPRARLYTRVYSFNQSQARSGTVFCVTLSNHIFLQSVIHIQCNADLPLHSSGFNQTQVLFMAAHSSLTLSSHFCPGLFPLRDPYTMQRGNLSVGTTTAGLLYPGVRPRTHDGTSEKLWRFGDRQCRPLWRGGVKACSTSEQINCIELT